MLGLGVPELIIIAVVVVLLFGSTRIPKLARSLAEAGQEIRAVTAERESNAAVTEAPAAPAPPTMMTKDEVHRMLDS